MPGTIIFKPIQANLLESHGLFGKMDTYCTISLGDQQIAGKVCKRGSKHPTWDDSLVVRRIYEPYCMLQIKEKELLKTDKTIGIAEIDLREVESRGKLAQWYKLFLDNQPAGEILIEAILLPNNSNNYKQPLYQQNYLKIPSPGKAGQENYVENTYSPRRQHLLGLRPITQMKPANIYGLETVHQVTYPHMSHHLTPEEYSKLHSRQPGRYQPTNQVVNEQSAPPSWPGYELYNNLQPQEDKETSAGSTTGGTPEHIKRNVSIDFSPNQESVKYYPIIGGVSYLPKQGSQFYRPYYQITPNQTKQQRKYSDHLEFEAKKLAESFEAAAVANVL